MEARLKVSRVYERCASTRRIERYLQHGLASVKGGLSGAIDTALKSNKITICNMLCLRYIKNTILTSVDITMAKVV